MRSLSPYDWYHLPQARRRGRAVVTLILIVVALTVGAAGGYWLPEFSGAGRSDGAASATTQPDAPWYSCGMHPDVLQRGPSLCPICKMPLTPVKTSGGSEGEGQAATSTERKILYWRAPMDPNYVSDHPGKSPMGMDLVPVYADGQGASAGHAIRIDPVTVQNMGIRTAVIRRGPLTKTLRTVGRVVHDESRMVTVTTKFDGYIEKLYADTTEAHVKAGDPLFDVYSPEIYSAQREFIAAQRSLASLGKDSSAFNLENAREMAESAKLKLQYLDLTDDQISALAEANGIKKTMLFRSPATGHITEKAAVQGMHFNAGTELFTIVDHSRVWVFIDVYEYQLPWVRLGQTATMTLPYVPGKTFEGQVVYIYVHLQEKARVATVRLEFENPNLELRPGMYANVTLEAELQQKAILIPREAFIDSGTRQVAFVDLGEGRFEPRDLQVGVEAEDGNVEVLYGVDEGEVVVTSGQFMLDAESKLKEAIAKITEIDSPETTKRSTLAASEAPTQAYTCVDHPHVFSVDPGTCPRCGKALVSFKVTYTCPDPDHSDVISTAGGNCPLCGQGLAAFRSVWLDESMAEANVPTNPKFADEAAYRCTLHPLVHSDAPGACTICGSPLAKQSVATTQVAAATQPVATSKPSVATETATLKTPPAFVCPMHADSVTGPRPGPCSMCGMQLVPKSSIKREDHIDAHVAAQMNFITEHYLELQERLAADSTTDVALHALGLTGATEELLNHLNEGEGQFPPAFADAAKKLHAIALKTTGKDIEKDRIAFVEMSLAMQSLVTHVRPDATRWPKLYIYHCPMSNGDWLQVNKSMANPYYGYKMLKCGELKSVK